ncbi:Crp/Fnr family transcriptional regulator [Streptomyces albus]|uniref:Crp/Fnr family transcriptional regulator n=1 Tax=Streptomyces albus TaxID=1888 RepID=UPI0007C6F9E5|nr:Crp/Fnr family transcriptional regulator [Streptomyces albus]
MLNSSNPNSRVVFLDTLSPGTRSAFTRLGTRLRYAVGDVLMREGDSSKELMILHDGLAKVTVRLDRQRVLLRDIRIAGDVVGEMAAMGVGLRSATVTSCGDVSATVIPHSELAPFFLAYPDASLALNHMLCSRLRRADRLRLELGAYPVPVRLARVLVELAESYGQPRRTRRGLDWNRVRIDVNLSQSEFAALTASATRTAHGALRQLRKDGIITTGCRQTTIENMARLRKVALMGGPAA